MIQRVFVDADVLFSACLRYWLFQLRVSTPSMFQLYTTEDVISETLARLRDAHPRWSGGQISRIRSAILEVFDEVVEEFDGSVDYQGSDPHDLHVHAAALACEADILLTRDNGLLHQPNADSLTYEAFHPDDFFVLVNDSAPLDVREATMEQLRYYTERDGARETRLVDSLIDARCPQFAEIVRVHLIDLAGALPRQHRRNLRRAERLQLDVADRLTSSVETV